MKADGSPYAMKVARTVKAHYTPRFMWEDENGAGPAAPTGIDKTDVTTAGANDGTLTGVAAGQEYRLVGASTWTAITTGTTVTGLAPGSYEVRVAATAANAAGTATTPFVIAEGPLAAGPAAPTGLSKTNVSALGTTDGTITNVTDAMEYKLLAAATYTPVAASATTISNLSAGVYNVRLKQTATHNAGLVATVTIQNPAPAALNIVGVNGTNSGATDAKLKGLTAGKTYEIHNGTDWTTVSAQVADANGEITDLAAGTYKVREKASADGLTPVGAESNQVTVTTTP